MIRIVNWKNNYQSLSHIRETVFIDEQNISPDDEWDDKDSDAEHVLATFNNEPIGCARIIKIKNDHFQIGRVAVLKPYRNKKVASNIIKTAIAHIWQSTCACIPVITLCAQNTLLDYYQKCGFDAFGETFVDAGIDHTNMKMRLTPQSDLTNYFGTLPIHSTHTTGITRMTSALVYGASREIYILSEQLNKKIYGHDLFVQAISNFARSSAGAKVNIIVKNTRNLSKSQHKLVELAKRLPSKILIRSATKDIIDTDSLAENNEWMLTDVSGLLEIVDARENQAITRFAAPVEVKRKRELFNYVWQSHTVADPNLSNIYL